MGLSLRGLVGAATESTLNIVNPGRGFSRAIESGDPSHLIPFGPSCKEWGTQLSSVLRSPSHEVAQGLAAGIQPDINRAKTTWRFLSDHKDQIAGAAAMSAPGGQAMKATIENPQGAVDVMGRAWKLLALGQT